MSAAKTRVISERRHDNDERRSLVKAASAMTRVVFTHNGYLSRARSALKMAMTLPTMESAHATFGQQASLAVVVDVAVGYDRVFWGPFAAKWLFQVSLSLVGVCKRSRQQAAKQIATKLKMRKLELQKNMLASVCKRNLCSHSRFSPEQTAAVATTAATLSRGRRAQLRAFRSCASKRPS